MAGGFHKKPPAELSAIRLAAVTMDVGINTKHPVVRMVLASIAVLFTPAGSWVLWGAFERNEPHIFVMLVFSGSLTLLLGLVGLIGFVASFAPKGTPADKTSDNES